MKHLIMGTAGHVDHGKTALTRALTNIDCDTHPEEKTRGITINLGFAHLDLPNGDSVGIVDVPGHKDFVNTMIAGANGIDFVMLVIAADSGVMPQTVEHLQIMQILGITAGLVALTKTDLADEELLLLVEDEITELLDGTFLQGCPIVGVSAETGHGLDTLKDTLVDIADKVEARRGGDVFRMFIDRIFTVQGFGTVVTGSVLGGRVGLNDTVYLLPVGKELRIRRMQRHGKEVDELVTGDRASLNLVGLSREDFQRGMVISDRPADPTTMLDAHLELFKHDRRLELWTQVVFILGTYTSQAKCHLIDRDLLESGESAIVQIHLGTPCVVQYGDHFVIRSSSSDITLGGGEVIDAHPLVHRRRPDRLVNRLQEVAEGGLAARIAAEVRKRVIPVTHTNLASQLGVSEKEITDVVADVLPSDIAVTSSKDRIYLQTSQRKDRLTNKILNHLTTYHKRQPLDEGGRTFDELMGLFGINRDSTTEAVMRLVLQELIDARELKTVGRTFALSRHEVVLSPEQKAQIDFVEGLLRSAEMKTPLVAEMIVAAKKRSIDEKHLEQILRLLTTRGKAYRIDVIHIHGTIVDRCRSKLLRHLAGHDDGITVAEFRDLVQGNRKICLLLLSQFDSEGVTIRSGDHRYLTEKGKRRLTEPQ